MLIYGITLDVLGKFYFLKSKTSKNKSWLPTSVSSCLLEFLDKVLNALDEIDKERNLNEGWGQMENNRGKSWKGSTLLELWFSSSYSLNMWRSIGIYEPGDELNFFKVTGHGIFTPTKLSHTTPIWVLYSSVTVFLVLGQTDEVLHTRPEQYSSAIALLSSILCYNAQLLC
jgi:hypothetical protein